MIKKLLSLPKLIIKLGVINSIKATKNKIYKKFKIYKFQDQIHSISIPLIDPNQKIRSKIKSVPFEQDCIVSGNQILEGKIKLFNKKIINFGNEINWHKDYIINCEIKNKNMHWSEINFFTEIDVKRIWELSRWQWGPLLARCWIMTKNYNYLYKLNSLINSWCSDNSANMGINWSDAQETAIRLIHALLTFKIVDQTKLPKYTDKRVVFIKLHLKRLKQTLFYEQSQNNNHWLSSAAGMFIGGGWLLKKSKKDKKFGNQFLFLGRNEIEKSIKKLVLNDGTFSQYSTNYHRLVLDTLCQIEVWRKDLSLPLFSKEFYLSCKKLTTWYLYFLDPNSGHISNIGANDGALCYQLISKKYRDCRPTAHLSTYLFLKKSLHFSSGYTSINYWLNLNSNYKFFKFKYPILKVFRQGGFGLIRSNKKSLGLIKFPKYIFRPSQADLLHFDLWHNGINIFKDGGTFSYNSSTKIMNYFSGIDSHNSIKFDNKEPMEKFSRFLFFNWPNTKYISGNFKDKNEIEICAIYECNNGTHKRKIISKKHGKKWVIIDDISKYKREAKLNWRLTKSNWEINKNIIESKHAKIRIKSTNTIHSIVLKEGLESEYYDHKNHLKVLEVLLKECPASIKTIIDFK